MTLNIQEYFTSWGVWLFFHTRAKWVAAYDKMADFFSIFLPVTEDM